MQQGFLEHIHDESRSQPKNGKASPSTATCESLLQISRYRRGLGPRLLLMSIPPPSAPAHLLRTHLAAVNALYISDDNECVYSGDASGVVIATSTRSFRPIAHWKAHEDGILGVCEWEKQILTHGRDNKLHVWTLVNATDTQLGESAITPGLATPALKYSMDVNALNYCRFSLLPLLNSAEPTALIALPNLVDSSLADIWELPSQKRVHAAIGKSDVRAQSDGRGGQNPTGIIMSMDLFQRPHPHLSQHTQLRLLCCYENGGVTMLAYVNQNRPTSIEGIGWEKLWTAKLHNESVMAMSVSRDKKIALTVSVDHLIGRYDLQAQQQEDVKTACTVHRTKYPGNGSVAIRDDGRICAVGGWDGKVRLFSTKSLKPLGTLEYHKKSCQCVVFARSVEDADVEDGHDEDLEDEMSTEEKIERSRWLIVGSQDNRVSIWPLISFGKTT